MLATPRSAAQPSWESSTKNTCNFSEFGCESPVTWTWWIHPTVKDDNPDATTCCLYLRVQRCEACTPTTRLGAATAPSRSLATIAQGLRQRPLVTQFLTSMANVLDKQEVILAVLFLPTTRGFVSDAGFVKRRLDGLTELENLVGFNQFNDEIRTESWHSSPSISIESFLSLAIGGALIYSHIATAELGILQQRIQDRLSGTWTSAIPVQRKRLSFVTDHLNLDATRHKWQAARDLGIDIVIVSSGNWWLEEDVRLECRNLFAEILEIDVTPDDRLNHRLTVALRDHVQDLDGICAGADKYLLAVARAAEALGLPSEASEAYTISTSKKLTRQLEQGSDESFEVEELADLIARIDRGMNLRFPMISKPAHGSLSAGVCKSNNEVELLQNVKKTAATFGSNGGMVIEPYVAGPEVDVNIVLLRGELLFGEVVDEPPSSADLDSNSHMASFAETQAITPSMLPDAEQAMLIDSVKQSVLRQGFQSGVFHCEARVRDSACAYSHVAGTEGMLDLQSASTQHDREASTFLLEVNARCPGLMSATATVLTSGVDFWGLQMLAAVGEWQRFRQCAKRFVDPASHVMLDTYCVEVGTLLVQTMFPRTDITRINKPYIDAHRSPMNVLRREWPSLARGEVFRHAAMVKSAAIYGGDPEKWLWLETVVLSSHRGRADMLKTSEQLRQRYESIVARLDQDCAEGSVR